MYAESAGRFEGTTTFDDLWNGERMKSVRRDFGTDAEWAQCRTCWFREIKYHSQREAWASEQHFDLETGAQFTGDAWDFREFK